MASTAQSYDFGLQIRYTAKKMEYLIGQDRPFMAMLSKPGQMAGTSEAVPVITKNPQGIAGSTRAVSQTNETNVGGVKFLATTGRLFGTVSIGDEVMMAARKNPGAWIKNQTLEIDGLLDEMSEELDLYCWSNGGNKRGRRASISTNAITLTDPRDARNFEVGMTLVASANDGSSTGHTVRAGSTAVTAVDRVAGIVTVASAAAITGFADNDYLFREGDFVGNTGVNIVTGIQYQIPGTSSPGALYGVTRTDDVVRLAGCWIDAASLVGKSFEERIQLLGARMRGQFRAKVPMTGYANPEDWHTLQLALQGRGDRALTDESTRFGFKYLSVITGNVEQKIYANPNTPRGTYFALRLDNWTLDSMGDLFRFIGADGGDGLKMLRKTSTDDYEVRVKAYPSLYTNAPLWNGRVPTGLS